MDLPEVFLVFLARFFAQIFVICVVYLFLLCSFVCFLFFNFLFIYFIPVNLPEAVPETLETANS